VYIGVWEEGSRLSNGFLFICILNGWHFYFKSVASEYLLLEIMWITRY